MNSKMPGATMAPAEIPPHLLEPFEKAEAYIEKVYGASPTAGDLVRLWIASGTVWNIVTEFERAVLGGEKGTLSPDDEGNFDERILEFWAASPKARSSANGDQPPCSTMAGEK
jgi:hypothetical protein